MMNSVEKSRILLLNLGLDSDKTAIRKVGVKELKEIFEKYGHLRKIIVFTRKILLKAFLEYDNFEQAQNAKNTVHETIVKNFGKARLYFSAIQELEFSNKYLEFWEEKPVAKPSVIDENESTKQSFKNSLLINSNLLSFRKENCQKLIQELILPLKGQQPFYKSINVLDLYFNKGSISKNNSNRCSHQLSQASHQLSQASHELYTDTCLLKNVTTFESIVQKKCTEAIFLLSKVVLVSNLGHIFKITEEIFNIFSAFGNISEILFMTNLQKALVEYTETEYACESITSLNNLILGDTKLQVSYSKYRTIDFYKNNKTENSMQFNQVFIVPFKLNRFKSKSQLLIVPLSTTLLISFPKSCRIQPIDVYLEIEKVAKPIKTKLIRKNSLMNDTEITSMLFLFKDIQSAVYVLYKCHNSVVKGALLNIFFF